MTLIAGVDEAGRGPWAGPVVIAAVILPQAFNLPYLNDSKKLTPARRNVLFDHILDQAIAYAWQFVQVPLIDRINILQATRYGMQQSVQKLPVQPTAILVDGRDVPSVNMPATAIVGGDASEPTIAAASILAKVMRDRFMIRLDDKYPTYGFAAHKGYGTKQHQEALAQYGVLIHHRRSYAPIKKLLRSMEVV